MLRKKSSMNFHGHLYMFSHFLRSHLSNIILFFSKLLICIYTQQRKMLNTHTHTHTHILNEYKPEEYECKLLTIQWQIKTKINQAITKTRTNLWAWYHVTGNIINYPYIKIFIDNKHFLIILFFLILGWHNYNK